MPRIGGWFKSILGTTFRLNADDIVVFMVGPSGGGKSSFIQEVTNGGHGLIKVGKDLRPCTTEVQAIRCELTKKAKADLRVSVSNYNYIVFVDTPSFHTGTGNDKKAEENTTRWLKESKCKSNLVGTIYVDRVANVPALKPTTIQEHLDSFAYTFPSSRGFEFPLPLRLRCILSYNPEEDVIGEDKIISRKNVFQEYLGTLGSSLFQGQGKKQWSTSFHPECFRRDKREEAWNAVVALLS